MIKEVFIKTCDEVSLHIAKSKIESIRTKDIVKSAIRIYDQGKVGIAGSLGEYDEGALTKKALEHLELGISYPMNASSDRVETREYVHIDLDAYDFICEIEEMMADHCHQFPDFYFHHDIHYNFETYHLKNDAGLDLFQRARYINYTLNLKRKNSQNANDGTVTLYNTTFDKESVSNVIASLCEGLSKPTIVPEGKIPVAFFCHDMLYSRIFVEALNGISYGSGSSLFAGKRDKKIFSNALTLYQSRNIKDQFFGSFFDSEGVVNNEDRYVLVDRGVLKSPFTDKLTANQFALPLTGAAGGEFDSIPELDRVHFTFKRSERNFSEILSSGTDHPHKEVLLILAPTGGSYSTDGHFSLHLQTGLLYDGEKFVHPVHDLTLTSDAHQMFGKDWIGSPRDPLLGVNGLQAVCMWMTVQPTNKKKN
jgi:PmbA protein